MKTRTYEREPDVEFYYIFCVHSRKFAFGYICCELTLMLALFCTVIALLVRHHIPASQGVALFVTIMATSTALSLLLVGIKLERIRLFLPYLAISVLHIIASFIGLLIALVGMTVGSAMLSVSLGYSSDLDNTVSERWIHIYLTIFCLLIACATLRMIGFLSILKLLKFFRDKAKLNRLLADMEKKSSVITTCSAAEI